MIVLAYNGVVIARGLKYVQEAERKGISGVRKYLPDDTRFERVSGGFVIADDQPPNWEQGRINGQNRYERLVAAMNTGRNQKMDSTSGLIERVARLEILLELILEERGSGPR